MPAPTASPSLDYRLIAPAVTASAESLPLALCTVSLSSSLFTFSACLVDGQHLVHILQSRVLLERIYVSGTLHLLTAAVCTAAEQEQQLYRGGILKEGGWFLLLSC